MVGYLLTPSVYGSIINIDRSCLFIKKGVILTDNKYEYIDINNEKIHTVINSAFEKVTYFLNEVMY